MKFSIAGKVYDVVDIQKISMRDMLLFEQQTEELGRPLSWGDVTRWQRELDALPDDQTRAEHPQALWVTAVSIWVARRAAGEDVTFGEAVDFPASEVRFIPDPQDHKPKKQQSGKAKTRPTRPGSAAAASAEQ